MKNRFIFFFISILSPHFQYIAGNEAKEKADVKFTNLKCIFDNLYIVNGSCKIKAVRGRVNYIEINETFNKEINDYILSGKLFYKYGTIFRPYLFDYQVDLCKICAKNASFDNKLEAIMVKAIQTVKGDNCHPCPYKTGLINFKWSFDHTFAILMDSFKFFLPAGELKFDVKFQNSKDHVYLRFIANIVIQPVKLSDLRMGRK